MGSSVDLLDVVLTALGVQAITGVALFILRDWLQAKLTAKLREDVDIKLAQANSEHRQTEERLRADLKSKEQAIQVLQSGALSARANRAATTFKRRVEAVDGLWSAFQELGPAKAIAMAMQIVKFEKAAAESAKNPEFRKLFSTLSIDTEQLKQTGLKAQAARPHLSLLAWAYFAVYQAIAVHAVMRMHLLRNGLNMPELVDDEQVLTMTKRTLPHSEIHLERVGIAGIYQYLDELEMLLLLELRKDLDGSSSDEIEVEKAKAILELTNMVAANQAKAQVPKVISGGTY